MRNTKTMKTIDELLNKAEQLEQRINKIIEECDQLLEKSKKRQQEIDQLLNKADNIEQLYNEFSTTIEYIEQLLNPIHKLPKTNSVLSKFEQGRGAIIIKKHNNKLSIQIGSLESSPTTISISFNFTHKGLELTFKGSESILDSLFGGHFRLNGKLIPVLDNPTCGYERIQDNRIVEFKLTIPINEEDTLTNIYDNIISNILNQLYKGLEPLIVNKIPFKPILIEFNNIQL